MNFITRAFVSITRNLGKTILLLLIVFALGCVISGAVAVSQAVQNTDTNLRRELPPIVSIEMDHDAAWEHEQATGMWPETEMLSLEQLSQIGTLPYVRNYDVSIGASLSSRELERVVTDEEMHWSEGDWEQFGLKGVHSADLVDIEEGVIELVSGRMLTEQEATTLSNVTMISEELAQLNNLHIGSTMTLSNVIWDMPADGLSGDDAFFDAFYNDDDNVFAQRSHDFEIVGIFRTLAEFNTGDEWNDASMRDSFSNQLYVSNQVAMDVQAFWLESERERTPNDEWLEGDLEDFIWFTNVYVLHDSNDIPAFGAAIADTLPDFWVVQDLGDSFADVASSMENIGTLANIILYVAVGASVLILSLLITLLLRERKKEIGVYLALGEGKGKVILQMMTEVLVVALVAVTLSLFAGNMLAGGISETMLRNDMATAQGSDMSDHISFTNLDWMGFSAVDTSTEEVMASYNVSLDATTIAIFFTVSIGIIIIATIIPMLYILRLNPRKIMM